MRLFLNKVQHGVFSEVIMRFAWETALAIPQLSSDHSPGHTNGHLLSIGDYFTLLYWIYSKPSKGSRHEPINIMGGQNVFARCSIWQYSSFFQFFPTFQGCAIFFRGFSVTRSLPFGILTKPHLRRGRAKTNC